MTFSIYISYCHASYNCTCGCGHINILTLYEMFGFAPLDNSNSTIE